ncbi:unnamed protein product [Spirodela intermedia]|uniref:Fe2OG dioxygenase domain-containing protein n=1 Tax=Spirodela intermedia TaxID=51605 RepID=A0A7I8K898_SPIIN|nr:unnamed protein product [Spirodela intermedia]
MRCRCVEAVRKAASEWGVMHIVNHAILLKLIKRMQEAGERFFSLLVEEKERYANDQSSGTSKATAASLQTMPAAGEPVQLRVRTYTLLLSGSLIFFSLFSSFQSVVCPFRLPCCLGEETKDFVRQLRPVVNNMLAMLSAGLGLEEGKLEEELGGMSDLLLQIMPNMAVGVPAHTDVSALSFILYNMVPGLQVHHGGQWVTVGSLPDTIIMHVGDSILHRVLVNKEKVRISWAVFCEPPPDKIVLKPLAALVHEGSMAKYPPRTFCEPPPDKTISSSS